MPLRKLKEKRALTRLNFEEISVPMTSGCNTNFKTIVPVTHAPEQRRSAHCRRVNSATSCAPNGFSIRK